MEESDIAFETKNLYLTKGGEIYLNGTTHAVLVGIKKDLEAAKKTMSRLEAHIDNTRKFHNHY